MRLVDHKLGPKDQLNAAYLYDDEDETVPYGGNNTFGPTLLDRSAQKRWHYLDSHL